MILKHFALLLFLCSAVALAQPKAGPAKPLAPAKNFLNKAAMADYVRHLRLYPKGVQVDVTDPKPSADMPGMMEVRVRASMGSAAEESLYLVSKDGKKAIEGRVYDAAQNPFQRELSLLKTDFQPSMGTAGAPVVIVVFSDFQCGYCKKEGEVLRKELMKAFPTQVRVYFKDFPLEQIHPWAKPAAIGGRCVFRQKATAFWDYHDFLFDRQEKITPENLKTNIAEFAKANGLDQAQMDACMASPSSEAEVVKAQTEGAQLGVQSTPTLFINGRKLGGSVPWENLKQIVEFEIGYQAVNKNAGEACCTLQSPSLLGPAFTTPAAQKK